MMRVEDVIPPDPLAGRTLNAAHGYYSGKA